MRLSINIEKRYAYIILGLLIIIAGGFVVYAVAPNPGHTAGEIDFSGVGDCSNICTDAYCTISGSDITCPTSSGSLGGTGIWAQSGSNIYYDGGNVGIGISAPNYKLDINGDISGTRLRYNGYIVTERNNDELRIANDYYWQNIGIYSNGIERIRIDPNGNVGIGDTSPEANLQVRNNLRIGGENDRGYLELAASSSANAGAKIYVKTFSGKQYDWDLVCDGDAIKIQVFGDSNGQGVIFYGDAYFWTNHQYECGDGTSGFCAILCIEATRPLP